MSTKIYDGFRFKQVTFEEIDRDIQAWRERIKTLTVETSAKIIAERVVEEIDAATSNGKELEPRILGRALVDIWDRQREIKKTGRRDPRVDLDFNLVILPDDGKFYGIFYTEQSDWSDEFRSLPWFEEFGYWNNTDKPDELTDEQWMYRREVWERIFPRFQTPAQRGYCAECAYTPDWSNMVDLVPKYIPPKETRARQRGKHDAINYYLTKHYPKVDDQKRVSLIMSMYMEATDWLKTDEGKAFWDQRTKDLLPGLRDITTDLII